MCVPPLARVVLRRDHDVLAHRVQPAPAQRTRIRRGLLTVRAAHGPPIGHVCSVRNVSRRQRTRDERLADQERAQLVRLAAGAEARRRGQERERGDGSAEHGAERGETGCVRDGRRREEHGSDEIREARRPRVLQRAFAEQGLHELEVGEGRQAEAPAERQPDDQLGPEQAEQPPPAGRDREHGQDADRRLVEPGSARVDHVEVAIWVGRPLHFPKYYELARVEVSPNAPWVRQTWTEYCFQMGREGVVMATFREDQMRTGWSRTRWLLVIGVLVAIAVAVVLLLVYSGGGGSGGGGGGY